MLEIKRGEGREGKREREKVSGRLAGRKKKGEGGRKITIKLNYPKLAKLSL